MNGAAIEEDVVGLLQRLVRAPSPNPPGDERAVQAVVREYLGAVSGIEVTEVAAAANRPIVIARVDTGRPGPAIALGGHVDTVPLGDGWTRDPVGGDRDDGRVYGRGASDMKGGVASLLVALRLLAANVDSLTCGTVVAHVVPDEEAGGKLGMEALLRDGLIAADAAIVAEPSELAVFRAQKGNIFATMRIAGRSAHGSMPGHGINAISAAAHLIVDMEDRLRSTLTDRGHELLGHASINIGTIKGGTGTNVVPDECIVTIDRRTVPGERLDDAIHELTEFVGSRAAVTIADAGASFETPADHWLVRAATGAVEEVCGGRAEVGGLVGSSDAPYYSDVAGIPAIILGPGSMSQAHTPDEFVDCAQLTASVRIYERLVFGLLGRGGATGAIVRDRTDAPERKRDKSEREPDVR